MVDFDQMWFIFLHIPPPAVHALSSIHVAIRLHTRGIEALILIIEKSSYQRQIWPHHRSYTVSPANFFCFFHVGELQNIVSWYQIRRIWRVINQFKPAVTHSSHCNHCSSMLQPQSWQCAGALSWWNRTPFVSFLSRLRNVSSTTFQSPDLLIQCGLSGGK